MISSSLERCIAIAGEVLAKAGASLNDVIRTRIFLTRAEDCRQAASELQSLVLQYGGKAEDGGSISGAIHRGWVKARSAVTSTTDLSLLEETERGEDVALAAYRKAVEDELPEDLRVVLGRHLQGTKRNHDQIRDLRNQARAMSA